MPQRKLAHQRHTVGDLVTHGCRDAFFSVHQKPSSKERLPGKQVAPPGR